MKILHMLAVTGLGVSALALAACSDFTSSTKSAHNADSGSALSDDAMQRGRMLFARGEYALAIDQFKKVARFAPNSPAGYNGLAASYDMLGRFDVSREYYQLALSRSPEDPMILRNVERSLAMQGRGRDSKSRLSAVTPSGQDTTTIYERAADAQTFAALPPPLPVVPAEAASPVDERNQLMRMSGKVVELKTAAVQPAHHGPMPKVESVSSPKKVTVALSPVKDWSSGPMVTDTGISMAGDADKRGGPVAVALNKPKAVRDPAKLANRKATTPTIKILNAAGAGGVARKTQVYLARKGTDGTSIGDARKRLPDSWVIYPASQRAEAAAVRKNLPFGTRVHVDAGFERVVILIGEDAAARLIRSRGT